MNFGSTLHGFHVRGHEFAIELEELYIRVSFALHRQVIAASEKIFEEIKTKKYFVDHIVWQIVIKVPARNNQECIVLLFSDYNKMAQFRFILKFEGCQMWDPARNCDPMTTWNEYEEAILREIGEVGRLRRMNIQSIISVLSGDKLFNGFGANHSAEALFYARIHPLATTSSIFNDEESLHRLLKGLHMASRLPRHWNKYISKSPNLNSQFYF